MIISHYANAFELLFILNRQFTDVDNGNLNHILMRDKANFHLCGNVSSKKCHYGATKNHYTIDQKPLQSDNFIVWCCGTFFVIGPYFFEG
jgi:hypothetical protein